MQSRVRTHQGRHVQGTQYSRATSSKGRIVRGTECPRLFVWGHIVRVRIAMVLSLLSIFLYDKNLEPCFQTDTVLYTVQKCNNTQHLLTHGPFFVICYPVLKHFVITGHWMWERSKTVRRTFSTWTRSIMSAPYSVPITDHRFETLYCTL